ncbi:serine/threonine-protein kinase [Streptomyces sp. MZ04]|uniref:serine/threonine-protein kinase n=1 Tax=Streptomyces sp. MZ04 TaxID=2559236 RepID=UPI00107ED4F6|nr:serine/threonine-protein kinase [Streptomyces sp. MZ04]TGA86166.1 serine/threonine protein kinase [Streptomyces sp. MZ04]
MQGLLLAGRYRLGESIGHGGMGRVWRARDEVLHRAVAVKELTAAQWVQEADRAILFARTHAEARAAARINHPAVVTVHDVLEYDERPWIVMELVEGCSLADAVKERGRVEPLEAARIGLWTLKALRAAHAAGVLHRDVKPGNVLLADDRRILLTDFGIAAIEGDTTITRTGEVVGSVDYLAPERVSGADPGPASDLWALGATLYTAVEGNSPFRRTSPLGTMQAVVTEEPAPPEHAGALAPVISALLRKDPEARPTAEEAELMLAEAAEGRRPSGAQAYVPTQVHATGRQPVQHEPMQQQPVQHERMQQQPVQHEPMQQQPVQQRPVPQAAYSAEAGTAVHGATGAAAHGHGSSGTFVHSGHPDHSHRPQKRRKWPVIVSLVAAAALLGGGGAAAYLYLGDGKHEASTQSGDGDPGKAVGGIPADWPRVNDPEGFSLRLPKNWAREMDGNQIDYTPDHGRHFVRISVDRKTAWESPYLHQLDLEKNLKVKLPAYKRLQLDSNTYRDRPGALWEFSWTAGANDTTAGKRRAISQSYLSRDGIEYVVYMSSPAEDWDTARQQFDAILRSFGEKPVN